MASIGGNFILVMLLIGQESPNLSSTSSGSTPTTTSLSTQVGGGGSGTGTPGRGLNMERLWAGDLSQLPGAQQLTALNLSWAKGPGGGAAAGLHHAAPPGADKPGQETGELDDEDQPMICMICEDKATGLHYGIITCEGWVKLHYSLPASHWNHLPVTQIAKMWIGCLCRGCSLESLLIHPNSHAVYRLSRVPRIKSASLLAPWHCPYDGIPQT